MNTVWNLKTTHAYTSDGAELASTTAQGDHVTTATYDGAGRTLSRSVNPGSTPPLGTDYAYDSYGRPVAVKSPDDVVTATVYNTDSGRAEKTIANCIDAPPSADWSSCTGAGVLGDGTRNQAVSVVYDGVGNKIRETSPNGTVTAYTYDTAGHLASQTANFQATRRPTRPSTSRPPTTTMPADVESRRPRQPQAVPTPSPWITTTRLAI